MVFFARRDPRRLPDHSGNLARGLRPSLPAVTVQTLMSAACASGSTDATLERQDAASAKREPGPVRLGARGRLFVTASRATRATSPARPLSPARPTHPSGGRCWCWPPFSSRHWTPRASAFSAQPSSTPTRFRALVPAGSASPVGRRRRSRFTANKPATRVKRCGMTHPASARWLYDLIQSYLRAHQPPGRLLAAVGPWSRHSFARNPPARVLMGPLERAQT